MNRNTWRLAFGGLLVASVVLHGAGGIAADWPTFRGADRSAVSHETGLLKEWPAGGPPLLWRTEGTGRGYASLAIVGNRIFTLGDGLATADDKDEYLLCLNREDGKEVWKTRTGPAWSSGSSNWQSSRSTPTVDGEIVYALTAEGMLICCDVDSGSERWRKSLKQDFGGNKADGWGYSESVLIDGDQLVCTPGGKSTMVALDKLSGELKWKAVRAGDKGAGHASIVISEVGGMRVYVQTTGSGALGVRSSDGQLLWSYPFGATAVIPTPLVRGDLVFVCAGYRRGGALLRQTPDSQGGVTIEEVYAMNPQLANKHGGVVLVGDYIYGDSEDSGVPFCASLMTGEVAWKKRLGGGSASMASAEGRLYIHSADGTVRLAKADPADYVEISTFKTPGSHERPGWSHPVILDGKLYLREQGLILCYDIKGSPTP